MRFAEHAELLVMKCETVFLSVCDHGHSTMVWTAGKMVLQAASQQKNFVIKTVHGTTGRMFRDMRSKQGRPSAGHR